MIEGSPVTVMSEDHHVTVWGDDAPEVFQRMSVEPARRYGDAVVVCSAAAVPVAVRDPGLFSSGVAAGFLGSETGLIPLQVDPPEHVRYRKMLDPMFSPRRMGALRHDVTAFANECIDAFAATGYCDFSTEFAVPFPTGTFLRLLGLPFSGLPHFLDLKDRIIRPAASTDAEMAAVRSAAGRDIVSLFDDALGSRERAPGEDILSDLTRFEAAGELSREQSLNICHLLLLAGLDTVTGALETSFVRLARRPELQDTLSSDPSIVPSAVEELLRWSVTSPSQGRVATRDTEVEGCPVRQGDQVKIVNAVVNFDPAAVIDPLRVDLARAPNRHASFGIGIHRCLGSHLARLELHVALREWHRRIPAYRLPEGHPIIYSPALREIRHLPLIFEPAPPGLEAGPIDG